jgi:RluA family pseudouridine synthase
MNDDVVADDDDRLRLVISANKVDDEKQTLWKLLDATSSSENTTVDSRTVGDVETAASSSSSSLPIVASTNHQTATNQTGNRTKVRPSDEEIKRRILESKQRRAKSIAAAEARTMRTAPSTTTSTTTTATTTSTSSTSSSTPSIDNRESTEADEESSSTFTCDVSPSTLQETHYYFNDRLRYVQPYYYTFESWTKRRWLNRSLLEVMAQEFTNYGRAYFEKKIADGSIRVDGQLVPLDYVLRDHQLITHRVHRHEPPVFRSAVVVVAETDELLVVHKPASLPTHPTGRYRHNTLLFVLAHEQRRFNLYAFNRLDKTTSGVMLLAKSSEGAAHWSQRLQSSQIAKHYLARVVGRFPHERLELDCPMLIRPPRLGGPGVADRTVHAHDRHFREAQTHFELLAYDETSDSSVVLAQPITGRTHQIRVHLKHLGHPIVNDPVYGPNAMRAVQLDNPTPLSMSSGTYDADCPVCQKPFLDPEDEQLELW